MVTAEPALPAQLQVLSCLHALAALISVVASAQPYTDGAWRDRCTLGDTKTRSWHSLDPPLLAGMLTPEHLEAAVDARTFSRLKDLLDGLATIGLLAPSLVRTDSSGQSAGLREARWAAQAHAALEEPAIAQGGWSRHSMAECSRTLPWLERRPCQHQWAAWLMLCGRGLQRGK